jgi:hypothetical protein
VHLRFLLSLALLSASVLWLGATPFTLPAPTVVVFPLTVNGEADKESGSRLATLFAQQLADNGVKVVAPPPGTQRTDFLEAARRLGCDYYVSGFITPLGQEVTVVEQIVSTSSGTVIASNSAQLLTYADANGQGAILATSILRHASRGLASLGENPPPATSPAPKESQNEANLSGLGRIFKRQPKATPSPAAAGSAAAATSTPVAVVRPTRTPASVTRTPASARPAPVAATAPPTVVAAAGPRTGRIVLFEFGGTAATDRRAYARSNLQSRLAKSGHNVAIGGMVDPRELVSHASDLCAQNGAKALVDGELTTRDGDASYGPSTIAQFDVRAVDCSGKVLFHQRFERDGTGRKNWERAIDGAVAAASAPLARAIQ